MSKANPSRGGDAKQRGSDGWGNTFIGSWLSCHQGHRLDGLRPRSWRKSEILTKEGTHMLQRLRSRLHSEEKGFTLIELLSSS